MENTSADSSSNSSIVSSFSVSSLSRVGSSVSGAMDYQNMNMDMYAQQHTVVRIVSFFRVVKCFDQHEELFEAKIFFDLLLTSKMQTKLTSFLGFSKLIFGF